MSDAELILADGRRVLVPAGQPLLQHLASFGMDGAKGAVAVAGNGQILDFMTPVPAGASWLR